MQVSADQPARDLVIQDDGALDSDHVLDEFAGESEAPSPGDSPREVARKMIAAREVRKRQVRKKTEQATDDGSADTAAPLPAQDSPVPAHPVAGALFGVASAEAPPVPEAPSPVLLNALEGVTNASVETSAIDPPRKELDDDVAQVAAMKAVDLALATEEPSERAVAVDDFRPREATGPRTDRNWPRVPERIASGRIDSGRLETETARPERLVVPQVSPIESIDADVAPLPLEAPPPERQRMGMLQVALWISLGLVLGYAAGYFRGSRETLAAGGTAVATRTAAEPQTPTTGRTAAKETTEQVVTPRSAPAVPPDASPTPAAPATVTPATAPAGKPTTPAAAKPTTPAAAKPTTAAAATPAPKPAPSPREARRRRLRGASS